MSEHATTATRRGMGPKTAPIPSFAADGIALAALMRAADEAPCCSVCDEPIVDEPGGSGLLLWARGEELRLDEPPLCAGCATAIGVTALRRWDLEDEQEG